MRFAIVRARFNTEITEGLLAGALRAFRDAKVLRKDIAVVEVPGSWEIPFAVHMLTKKKKYAAIVTIGAVIKGETSHDYWINHAVFPALQDAEEDAGIPVTLGIVTTNTWKQALARSRNNKKNRGYAAAAAAVAMARLFRVVKKQGREM